MTGDCKSGGVKTKLGVVVMVTRDRGEEYVERESAKDMEEEQ